MSETDPSTPVSRTTRSRRAEQLREDIERATAEARASTANVRTRSMARAELEAEEARQREERLTDVAVETVQSEEQVDEFAIAEEDVEEEYDEFDPDMFYGQGTPHRPAFNNAPSPTEDIPPLYQNPDPARTAREQAAISRLVMMNVERDAEELARARRAQQRLADLTIDQPQPTVASAPQRPTYITSVPSSLAFPSAPSIQPAVPTPAPTRPASVHAPYSTPAGSYPRHVRTTPAATTAMSTLAPPTPQTVSTAGKTKRGENDIQGISVLYEANALQSYYARKNEKQTQQWVTAVTQGLTDKFSLVRAEQIEADQLETVYDLTLRVHELTTLVTQRGLREVFNIYVERPGYEAFNLVGNLLDNFSHYRIDTVRKSVRFIKEYQPEYLIWGMTLTFQLIKDSCSSELRVKVNEQMMTIPEMERGGPTYLAIAMSHISSSNYAVARSLLAKIDTLHIKDYPGDDSSKVVGF